MARIEKNIRKDGHPESFVWDGIGGRIVFYALAIVLSKRIAMRMDKLIDVDLVRQYSTKKDWVLGFTFLLVTDIWIHFPCRNDTSSYRSFLMKIDGAPDFSSGSQLDSVRGH